MFNLDKKITQWRRQMMAGGVKAPEVLDELEGHLREDFEQRARLGTAPERAFEHAVQHIGLAHALRLEFAKLGTRRWNRPLALGAWALFVVSFILPSYENGPGWWCAVLQKIMWSDALSGHWPSIHYELLTLANLFMLASPFILLRRGHSARVMKWFRSLGVASVLLIWSYIGIFFIGNDWHDLRVGCFAWGTSFVLLLVSACRRPAERRRLARA